MTVCSADMSGVPLILSSDQDLELGGRKGIEDDFAYRNNVAGANVKIRLGFLRKVYSLLFVQLFITTLIGSVVMSWPDARLFVHNNDWLVTASLVASVVILLALHIQRKNAPLNFILLALFTVVEAYSVAVIVTFFDKAVVLEALALTVVVLGGLTLYTFQTKRDFSYLAILLFVGLTVLFFGNLMQIFIGSTQLEVVISICGAALFALFIVYDTQMLMNVLSPEEYIVATISLYLDIINLFIYVLRAVQATRRQ